MRDIHGECGNSPCGLGLRPVLFFALVLLLKRARIGRDATSSGVGAPAREVRARPPLGCRRSGYCPLWRRPTHKLAPRPHRGGRRILGDVCSNLVGAHLSRGVLGLFRIVVDEFSLQFKQLSNNNTLYNLLCHIRRFVQGSCFHNSFVRLTCC